MEKPAICTADELHYVTVPGTDWRLALWRYLPPPEAPKRNHPLMLLLAVGTNAIGFDLSPGASFACNMYSQGFDTWIVEVRGAGLSTRTIESKAFDQSPDKHVRSDLNSVDKVNSNSTFSEQQSNANGTPLSDTEITIANGNQKNLVALNESQLVMKLTASFLSLAEKHSGFLNEGLLETRQNSAIAGQINELSQRLVNIVEEGQRYVPSQLFDLQERLSATKEDFQKQLDLIVIYDWDFDNYLEEDVPAAVRSNT